MSMESDLFTLLQTACVRVYPDVAPSGAALPYITWQALGGKVLRNLNNTASDKRQTFMQINVWATTRTESNTLIRQIEDLICASSAMIGTPEGEALSMYEAETNDYGSMQRFTINAAR
jgi:hypothetical protein